MTDDKTPDRTSKTVLHSIIITKQAKICCRDNNTSRFNIAYIKKYKPKFDTLNDCSLRFTSENDFHTSAYNIKNEHVKDLLYEIYSVNQTKRQKFTH